MYVGKLKFSLSLFLLQVFYTLLVMGVFVIPPLYYAIIKWPGGPGMTAERRWEYLGEAITPYYRVTGMVITTYILLWKFTTLLPIHWGVDRLFAFLIGQSLFGVCIFAPICFIPVRDAAKVKFRRD